MKKYIWLSILCIAVSQQNFGQCNQKLVDIAAEQAGTDAIYIRDFKVKLSQGDMANPTPTGKFPIYLNKGVVYRFSIANAEEFSSKAYVELIRRGQKYADNFSVDAEGYTSDFDFECNRSATYQMSLNFGEGKQGCAAVVMSMVFQDTMAYIEPGFKGKSDSLENLYLWTNNKLQIASSESRTGRFEVSVSQGQIKKQGRYYEVIPEKEGLLIVHVLVYEEDRFIESDSVVYIVETPPLPRLILPGESGNRISRQNVLLLNEIKLQYPINMITSPYTLERFYISKNISGLEREVSFENRLSFGQLNLIKGLKSNEYFYIIDAVFRDPEGGIHHSVEKAIIYIQ